MGLSFYDTRTFLPLIMVILRFFKCIIYDCGFEYEFVLLLITNKYACAMDL